MTALCCAPAVNNRTSEETSVKAGLKAECARIQELLDETVPQILPEKLVAEAREFISVPSKAEAGFINMLDDRLPGMLSLAFEEIAIHFKVSLPEGLLDELVQEGSDALLPLASAKVSKLSHEREQQYLREYSLTRMPEDHKDLLEQLAHPINRLYERYAHYMNWELVPQPALPVKFIIQQLFSAALRGERVTVADLIDEHGFLVKSK